MKGSGQNVDNPQKVTFEKITFEPLNIHVKSLFAIISMLRRFSCLVMHYLMYKKNWSGFINNK